MNLLWLVSLESLLATILAGLTFLFFLYFPRLQKKSLPENELPFITVVVPARNEEARLGDALSPWLSRITLTTK